MQRALAGLLGGWLLTGCAQQPPPMPTASALPTATGSVQTPSVSNIGPRSKNGNVVRKSGDTGAVMLQDSDFEQWSVECRTDPMDDRRECKTKGPFGGLFMISKSGLPPATVCVFGHNYPGVPAKIRFGSNAPITTDRSGCVPWNRVKDGILSYQTMTTEWFTLPGGVHNTVTSSGVLEDVMALTRELQKGPAT